MESQALKVVIDDHLSKSEKSDDESVTQGTDKEVNNKNGLPDASEPGKKKSEPGKIKSE